jgi:hypothetical protein
VLQVVVVVEKEAAVEGAAAWHNTRDIRYSEHARNDRTPTTTMLTTTKTMTSVPSGYFSVEWQPSPRVLEKA